MMLLVLTQDSERPRKSQKYQAVKARKARNKAAVRVLDARET
jgi:hypothetical protein